MRSDLLLLQRLIHPAARKASADDVESAFGDKERIRIDAKDRFLQTFELVIIDHCQKNFFASTGVSPSTVQEGAASLELGKRNFQYV